MRSAALAPVDERAPPPTRHSARDLRRSCFATVLGGPDRRTLFMLTAVWRGSEGIDNVIEARTGQVLVLDAPAPGVGWPSPIGRRLFESRP